MTLFFYGSLRKGEDNYLRFMQQWPGQITDVAAGYISGFELTNLGTHCSIVPGAAESIVIGDVFEVSDAVFQSVEKLEREYDYRRQTVDVHVGDGAIITADVYGFARPEEISNQPRIAGGDWTKR